MQNPIHSLSEADFLELFFDEDGVSRDARHSWCPRSLVNPKPIATCAGAHQRRAGPPTGEYPKPRGGPGYV